MRLFAAIRFTPAVKTALLDAADALRRQGSGTFTRAGNLHLTLAFIGETEDLEGAKAALDAACGGGPFPLAVESLGRFGDLLWAGVEASRSGGWRWLSRRPCGSRGSPSKSGTGAPM